MQEMKCQQCGQHLKLLRWNSEKDILICDNGKCLAYRNPVSYLPHRDRSENKTSIKSYEERDGRYVPCSFSSMFDDIAK